MRIVLLGPPGSGKGTQARMVADNYKVPHISTGEILRANVLEKTLIGKKIASTMKAGDLVSDEIVIDAVVAKLRSPESRRGFILDGFPRNIPQAQELDTRLGWVNRTLQLALHFSLDEKILVKRLSGRIVCEDCGAIYNRYFSTTKKRGICDQCESKNLGQRPDDNVQSVGRRLEAYQNETAPLISYYRAQHKLRTLPSDIGMEEMFKLLCEIVDIEIRPLDKKVVPDTLHKVSRHKSSVSVDGVVAVSQPKNLSINEIDKKTTTKKKVAKKTTTKKKIKKVSSKKRTARR